MSIDENKLKSLLREFWQQAITRNELNQLKGVESLHMANHIDFETHFKRLKDGALPEKIDDLIVNK